MSRHLRRSRSACPPSEQRDRRSARRRGQTTVDDALAASGRQIDLLHERRQALITAAVTGQLDDLRSRGMSSVSERLFEDAISGIARRRTAATGSASRDDPSGRPTSIATLGLDTRRAVRVHRGDTARRRGRSSSRPTAATRRSLGRGSPTGSRSRSTSAARSTSSATASATRTSRSGSSYRKPAHGLTPELVAHYDANRLTVTRQLPFEPGSTKTLDLCLFVNGIPVATAELKNPLTGPDRRARDRAVPHRPRPDERDARRGGRSSTSRSTPTRSR